MMSQYRKGEVQRDCDLIQEIGETEFDLASWLIAKGETTELDASKAQYVSWILQNSPGITCLDLIDCTIVEGNSQEAEKAKRILVDFLQNTTSIKSIKVGVSESTSGVEENIDWVEQGLQGNQSIVSLVCYICDLENVGRILHSVRLEQLELVFGDCYGRDETFALFLDGLKQQTQLKKLSVRNSFFEQVLFHAQILNCVVHSKSMVKSLKSLDLHGMDLSFDLLKPITRLLEDKESCLEEIDLTKNPTLFLGEDDHNYEFEAAVRKNCKINFIHMSTPLRVARFPSRRNESHRMMILKRVVQSYCDRNRKCSNLVSSLEQCQDSSHAITIGGLAIQQLAAQGLEDNATPIFLTLTKLAPVLFH